MHSSPPHSVATLLLPNEGHAYGNCLQAALAENGVVTLKTRAGWGFNFHRNLALIEELSPDILHLQWPEALYSLQPDEDLDMLQEQIRTALHQVKAQGTPVVWTMHNLRPHLSLNPEFQAKVYGHFAAHADGVIHHSYCGMHKARETYNFNKKARHIVLRHGFKPPPPCPFSRAEARARLDLPADARILLFCGAFRKDKNLDVLIRAISGTDTKSTVLVIVGQEKRVAASLHPGLDLEAENIVWPGRLADEELCVYAQACDALVSAHGENHLTSAGPHLSQTYLKPHICPRCDYNEEILGKSAFYFETGTDPVGSLQKCLAEITPEALQEAASRLEQSRQEYAWESIGEQTKSFYLELLNDN